MLNLFAQMLRVMEAAFEDYQTAAGPVQRVDVGPGWVYRFEKKDIYHAVLMKLALLLSTLHAARTLNKAGHFAQQAMLQRVIEEANEDILFLVYAATNDSFTELHQRYLDAFWAEEYADHHDTLGSHQSRPMIPRKKIQAFLARIEGTELDPSRGSQLSKLLAKTYSGFVHGASPNIMEMYGGEPPRFFTRSLSGTPREDEYRRDLWNYMYRGFLSFVFAAKMYGAEQHVEKLVEYKEHFEAAMGKDYG